MRIGSFELHEPLPELRQPHLLVVLRPWIDVGSVGTLALGTLQEHFNAQELGRLARPGDFYDFTRYRPTIRRVEGEREITVPNSVIYWARGNGEHDWLFLHLLEPHVRAEDLLDSMTQLMERFDVRRYGLVGAMYGAWPHTRPLLASGSISEPEVQERLERFGLRSSGYEGPTSVMAMATEAARSRGIGVLSMLVQLPPYSRLEEDHKGQEALLMYLNSLYDWGLDLTEIAEKGDQQYAEMDKAMQTDRQMRGLVRRLEKAYDSEVEKPVQDQQAETPDLPDVVQNFLRDLEQGRENN